MVHVPRLQSEKVNPPWLKAFPFKTAPGELGASGFGAPLHCHALAGLREGDSVNVCS